NTWHEMLVGMLGAPATDETELGRWVTDLVTAVRQHRVGSSRPQETNTVDRGPKIYEDNKDIVDSTLESTRTS
ncbi:hypothetical protein Tco_0594394, partial [Tanacetum coccineum]